MPVVINGSTGISGTDGSAATPAVQGSDANTGVFFPAADTIAFAEGGVEAMRIDSSGNVGIGTSNPDMRLTLQSNDAALTVKDSGGTTRAYIGVAGVFGTAPTGALRIRSDQGGIVFGYQGIEQAGIDTSNNFRFNSGYGSVATAYGCRAWVNFNGTGVVAIRASGNVTAITDNGTGKYTVNFTSAMPDANYAVTGSCIGTTGGSFVFNCNVVSDQVAPATGSVRVRTMRDDALELDPDYVHVVVAR